MKWCELRVVVAVLCLERCTLPLSASLSLCLRPVGGTSPPAGGRREVIRMSRRRKPDWGKVTAFATLGRLALEAARFAWVLLNGEGPGPLL